MMADNEFLRYLFTEPVYVLPGEITLSDSQKEEKPVMETLPQEPAEAAAPVAPQLIFKGNNKAKVLILVEQSGEDYINAADEGFLTKILQAVKLSIDDTAIANVYKNSFLTEEALLAFDAEKYLIFGVSSKSIFTDASPYKIEIINQKQILPCSSLDVIAHDPSQKKLLWTALQEMFL